MAFPNAIDILFDQIFILKLHFAIYQIYSSLLSPHTWPYHRMSWNMLNHTTENAIFTLENCAP